METSQAITKRSASNLALAFILLPREKRDGMSALYAFCREVDDIADEETMPTAERRRRLGEWREAIRAACSGGNPELTVIRELKPFIEEHRMPFALFDEVIRGVEMDLETHRYNTHEELELYCYRVASAVGLLSIEIFGYQNPACHQYAVHLGKALQLTNILRDVRTDAERGRIYLPKSELDRFKVTEEEILGFRYSERYHQLARSVCSRAEHHYNAALAVLPPEDRRSMIAAELMGAVYWRLLEKLKAVDFNVFGPSPTRVSKPQKAMLIFRTWYRASFGAFTPSYGTSR